MEKLTHLKQQNKYTPIKKSLLFILLLLTTTTLWAQYSFSALATSGQTLFYKINSDGTSVTLVPQKESSPYYTTKPTGDLIIPSTVTNGSKTYAVTSIGRNAFYGCTGLTSVTIPNSVISIGYYAFYNTGWWNTQPDGIIYKDNWYIGYKGSKPTGTLTLQEGTKGIAEHAFYECTGLTGTLTIPNSVTGIGTYAFKGCIQLTGIVTIPNSVKSIGANPFSGCSKLTEINVVADNPNYISIDGILYNTSKDTLIGCPAGKTGSITILNSVTYIGNEAFYNCSGLTGTLNIPNSVILIGGSAFYNCSKLTGPLTIPNSVTQILDKTFAYCKGLTGPLTIPNSVTYIGFDAFYNCSGLTGTLNIPNSVIYIKAQAFEGCKGFSGTLTIPNSVTYISDAAFASCSGLTGALTIPNSVTSIEYSVFSHCSGLTSITIPTSVTSIDNYAFSNCTGLTCITIPNSVTSIGGWAFTNCSGLAAVYCEALTPPSGMSGYTNQFSNYNIPLYVPSSKIGAYKSHAVWGQFTTILPISNTPYTVSVSVNNASMGTATGGGNCNHCETITLTATPKTGYHFVKWNDENTDNPRTVAIIKNSSFKAFFAINTYTVTAAADDASKGSVTGGGTYNHGKTATLTAIPKEGYHFVQWSDGNTDNARTVTATQDSVFTAIFAANSTTYTVTADVNDPSMGSVSGGGEYSEGETVTLIAIPKEGYHFVKWSDENTDNPRTVTVTEETNLTAIFAINTYTVTATTDDASKGSVTGGGTYNHGETATLTATPEEGYHFVQWSDGNTDNARTVTATQDSVFTAIFAINTYTVTVAADDASKGSVTGGGTYNHGETATLKAIPNAGYCFFGWSDGSTENPRGVTATQDSTITAIFDFKRRNHTATVCQGEAYAYQDSVFNTTTAGTYSKEVRFSNAYDCDSVVTVTLTVTEKSSATGIMLKDTCFEMGKATQLKVESPVATATYRFYDSHHALLHTGTEYTTAPLSSEGIFYVTMQEPSKCESAEKSITVSECVTPTHLFQLHKTVDNASVCKNSIVTITTVIEKLTPALIHKIQIIEDFGFADLKLLTAELKIDGKTVPYTRDVAHNKLFFNMGELSGIGTYTLTITARAFPNLGPKTETTTIRWANYPTGITETASFNVVD